MVVQVAHMRDGVAVFILRPETQREFVVEAAGAAPGAYHKVAGRIPHWTSQAVVNMVGRVYEWRRLVQLNLRGVSFD